MKKFSKNMMALCAQTLKFLVPYTEKFSDPSYQMPDDALDQLQKMVQAIVKNFLESPANVRQEFRGIADDVESLRRLDDLIQKSREGFVSADLKAEIMTVRKRLTSIKVILNRELGMASRQGSGCILPLIILVVLAIAGWFFRGTIMKFVPFLGKPTEVQTTQDPDADSGDDADEEGDEAETTKPETVSEPEPAAPSEPEAEPTEPETPAVETPDEEDAPEKAQTDNKTEKKPAKAGTYRVWTDIHGKKLRARFIRMDSAGTIILEYKDKVAGVKQRAFAVGNFCEKDQEFIRKNYLD
ncbi:MAG: hypothetical protein K6C40_04805 [Thermoguttaceae bacterium]|nr:hypothetical protein [Thermoguttaceae bacterium]